MDQALKTAIRILNDGQFHSGTELGNALGLTRAGVWKLLHKLSAWDIEIETRTRLGYRMLTPRDFLDKDRILAYISSKQRDTLQRLEIHDCLSSTNDYLIQLADQTTQGLHVCLAEKQTGGKGRLGRTWHSPYASNVYLSLLWHYRKDCSQLLGLSLAIAVAIAQALQEYGIPPGLQFKWPNDIYWQGKKLAGILIEMTAEAHNSTHVILGIGLNVNMPKNLAQTIKTPWIDLTSVLHKPIDRNHLTGLLLKHLLTTLVDFQRAGFTPFHAAWSALDATIHQPITLITPQGKIKGTGLGVDPQGCLLIKTPQGELKRFTSGDISLRF